MPYDIIPKPNVPVVDPKTGLMDDDWYDFLSGFVRQRQVNVLPYSASIDTDASAGDLFSITATNGTAFTIKAPSNPRNGRVITYTIRNASGGALGAITWNAVFKMPAFTSPAAGNSRSVTFQFDGTNWVQRWQSAADVPN